MSPSLATLTDLLNSLDAATYFFVSSGIFVGVTALLFLLCGLTLGRIFWGRYKRRYRESEEVIEAFKGEVALLKRRIAEQSTRHSPSAGPNPLQAIAFKAASQAPQPRTVAPVVAEDTLVSAVISETAPPAKGFTIWTDPGWSPQPPRKEKLPPSRAFTLWAEPPARKLPPEPFVVATSLTSTTQAPQLLFSPLDVFMAPKSRAFALWTDKSWTPPRITPMPMPPARSFALWTLPDFEPSCHGPRFPSSAFSLWTAPGWTPLLRSNPPARSARSFAIWTEPDWKPITRLPWSRAFSIWTEAGWVPAPISAKPPPLGAPWSIWTGVAYEPACRGALLPSRSFSVWTEEGWEPAPIPPQPKFTAHPYSLWTEIAEAEPAAPKKKSPVRAAVIAPPDARSTSTTISATPAPRGLLARALAAVRKALGVPDVPPSPRMAGVQRGAPDTQPPPKPAVRPSIPPAPAPKTRPPAGRPTPTPAPSQASVPQAATLHATHIPMALATPSPSEPIHMPARTAEPARVSAKPPATPPVPAVTLAATAATMEALRKTGRVPVMSGPVFPSLSAPLPPSQAFTMWGSGPAFAPAQKITQRIALAALIESKITGRIPLPPAAPALPPVPPVAPPPRVAEGSARQAPPAPQILDLEPLGVPGRPSPGSS